jgi:hypothetical protein
MRALSLLPIALALVACSAYDDNIGPTPYLCGETDPPCPEGYACQDDITTGEQVCVGGGGSLSNDFDCADDSELEPNNLLDVATATPLDAMKTYAKEGLAICPANDKDLFAITIGTQNENIELNVEFQANGATLVGAILNAGGIPIATAKPVTGEPTKIRAFAQNLPAGQYYAQIAAGVSATLTLNNYKLDLDITGP